MANFGNAINGLSGINATQKRLGGKLADIENALKAQHGYQLNYQSNRINYFPILSYKKGSWQMDLMFPPKFNKIGVILCCIDISTRYLYAYCYNTVDQTFNYIKKFLEDAERDKRKVSYIQMDRGPEFTNKKVQELFKDLDYRYVNVGDKRAQGMVERVNETLRRLITNYISANNTNDWVSVFDDLVYNYNHRYNRGLGGIPSSANYNTANLKELVKLKLAQTDFNKFKIGNSVRVLQRKEKFQKGRQTWSHEVYIIKGIKGNKFLLNDDELYRHWELQKVISGSTDAKADYHEKQLKDKKDRRVTRSLNKEGIEGNFEVFDGEKYVGTKIRKKFGNKYYDGVIVGYKKSRGDPTLASDWKVKYDDGDEETFNLAEIKKYKIL